MLLTAHANCLSRSPTAVDAKSVRSKERRLACQSQTSVHLHYISLRAPPLPVYFLEPPAYASSGRIKSVCVDSCASVDSRKRCKPVQSCSKQRARLRQVHTVMEQRRLATGSCKSPLAILTPPPAHTHTHHAIVIYSNVFFAVSLCLA